MENLIKACLLLLYNIFCLENAFAKLCIQEHGFIRLHNRFLSPNFIAGIFGEVL